MRVKIEFADVVLDRETTTAATPVRAGNPLAAGCALLAVCADSNGDDTTTFA